jgi:hypothetical protein
MPRLVAPASTSAVQALPHYDDVYAAKPADVLPDGAGLWVLAGHKKDEYKLIARFRRFPDASRGAEGVGARPPATCR